MKHLVVCVLFLVACSATAQTNLVPNPSFEEYSQCPDFSSSISIAINWHSPTTGTPDYFNTCTSSFYSSIPDNYHGWQYPRTGNAYAGLGIYNTTNNIREYIQTKLISPLETLKPYCITFYVSVSEYFLKYYTNNIGMYISTDSISDFSAIYPLLYSQPQINEDAIINDSIGWYQITGYFIAQGNEKYITIGNFIDDMYINKTEVVPNIIDHSTYLFVDDVSVVECDTFLPIKTGNVITPNSDGYNDVFEIQFLPPKSQLTIYSRWGNQVYSSTKYQNNWDGAGQTDGVYFYVLTLPSGNSTKGTVTILRGDY